MDLNMKIDLKNIDFDKIKSFLKRKETLIAIAIIIFIIGIIITGNILLNNYSEAVKERDLAEYSYNAIIHSDTNVNSLLEKINMAGIENDEILNSLSELSQRDIAEALLVIQKDTGVYWENKSFSMKNEIKGAPGLKGISVVISNFTATYDGIKGFMEYIENYDRKVTIDALSFARDNQTGKMKGNMTLTFYMKNNEAT